VTDLGRVVVFDLAKKRSYLIGIDADKGRVKAPVGIAASSDGRLFVGDAGAARIFVYDTNNQGSYLTAIGQKGELETPSGLALDEKRRRLYVVDSKRHHVAIFSLADYRRLGTIGKRGVGPGEFNFPTNAAVDAQGNLYVVDTGNFRVQVFDPEERHVRTFGKAGDSAGSFARPKGIALDAEGHIYVVDAAFQNFQILDQEGRPLIAIGKGGRDPGSFLLPAGMTIDSEDRIYVVDGMTARVQIFQYLGEKWKARQAEAPAAPKGAGK
jgi:DNA-binding beta-propeller fold protein YncE